MIIGRPIHLEIQELLSGIIIPLPYSKRYNMSGRSIVDDADKMLWDWMAERSGIIHRMVRCSYKNRRRGHR